MLKPSTRPMTAISRLFRLLAAAAGLLLVVVGSGAASAQVKPALVPPAQDPFYTYTGHKPLALIPPGTVLKKRAITLSIASLTVPYQAEQVLYRTTGELRQPTATVTTIIKPLAGSIGTKIVSYQTAYDALGAQCDPSFTLQGGDPSNALAAAEAAVISLYVTQGYTVTVPDYEGTHLDWGAGQESGYGTLDGLRAAESYLQDPASTPVGMVGYSGGSIATEWASELAPTYAPALNIIGAAAGGVPVDFAQNLTYINGDQDWAGVIPAILVSMGRAFDADIHHYLSPLGQQITQQVANECITSFATAYPGLTYQQLVKPKYANPFGVPLLVKVLNHQIMGSAPGHPAAPLLLGVGNADGTGDGIMVAGDVEALAHEYCQQGVPVTFQEYTGQSHTAAAVPFEVNTLSFLASQFAGSAPGNNCSSVGPGTSIAPLPKPHHH